MRKITCFVFACFLSGLGIRAVGAESAFPYKIATRPVLTEVPRFRAESRDHLVYELVLDNFNPKPLHIEALQIQLQNAGKDVFVKELRGEELSKAFSIVSESYHKPQDPTLAPGMGGVLFVFLDIPDKVGPADTIVNKIVVQESGQPTTRKTQEIAQLKIGPKPVRILASPLQGERWWTPNGPSNDSIHRRILIPWGDKIWAPERFATDWIRLDENGKNYTGTPDQNSHYHAYGAKVLAVAPGKVVAVKDGIPENVPTAKEMAVPINLETIGGNHVVIDIGGGLYAFYAHLQPGKIAVKVGDVVKTGSAIGLLGNSGNSTEPHLHFHVMDRQDPLMAQGQPFAYDHFTRLIGEVKLNAEGDPVGLALRGKEELKNEVYLNQELVNFP